MTSVPLCRFSTVGEPAARGPDLFQSQMEQLFSIGLAVSTPQTQPFNTRVTAYCGQHLRFAALHFSPHTTSSSHRGSRASRLLVTLQKTGVALVQQDGRESRIEAGDFFLIDPSRPFCIETGDILTHSIYLEPEPLRHVLPELNGMTARAIKGGEGAGALFRSTVDEVFSLVDTLQEPTAHRIADALPHLLAAALTALPENRAPAPTRLRSLHKQRILRHAREHLRHQSLDAGAVAEAVGLSTRYVYELFEDEPLPLMKWIWQQRLAHCHRELAFATLAGRTIGEVAYSWGYRDVAHFSRAFRQRYGQSPREFRRASSGSPAVTPQS